MRRHHLALSAVLVVAGCSSSEAASHEKEPVVTVAAPVESVPPTETPEETMHRLYHDATLAMRAEKEAGTLQLDVTSKGTCVAWESGENSMTVVKTPAMYTRIAEGYRVDFIAFVPPNIPGYEATLFNGPVLVTPVEADGTPDPGRAIGNLQFISYLQLDGDPSLFTGTNDITGVANDGTLGWIESAHLGRISQTQIVTRDVFDARGAVLCDTPFGPAVPDA